jgi:TrmH family RNA methyltransferase
MKYIALDKETNVIQRVLALRNSRNKRFHHQEFIIEGIVSITQALEKCWPIKSVFFNNECKLSEWAKTVLKNTQSCVTYATSKNMMTKISEREDCPELLIIGQMKLRNFREYMPSHPELVVVLDQPKSVGNLGMIIRSAAAFGVNAIVISGHAADEYDPQCVRSSVGSFFNIPIYRVEGINKFNDKITHLKKHHALEIIATGNKGDIALSDTMFNKNLLFIVFGNETHGISEGFRKIADKFIHIPLTGNLTSLNIGAAASIFLYEIVKQRT